MPFTEISAFKTFQPEQSWKMRARVCVRASRKVKGPGLGTCGIFG